MSMIDWSEVFLNASIGFSALTVFFSVYSTRFVMRRAKQKGRDETDLKVAAALWSAGESTAGGVYVATSGLDKSTVMESLMRLTVHGYVERRIGDSLCDAVLFKLNDEGSTILGMKQ